MDLKWTSNLSLEDKEDFQREVMSSRSVLRRLTEILKDEENGLDRSEMDVRVFNTPNWENIQAFKNGYRSCLSTISKFIDIEKD